LVSTKYPELRVIFKVTSTARFRFSLILSGSETARWVSRRLYYRRQLASLLMP
jgi:hypothetical protein